MQTAAASTDQRYREGVADGLRQADAIAQRFGLDRDVHQAIADAIAEATRP